MICSISKEFRFEASHQLPNHDGKCARLHGHSWVLTVWVSGPIQRSGPKEGMVQDYADIKALVGPIVDQLDHHHLGYGYYQGHELPSSVEGFNVYSPTSENILMWIADQISQAGLDWSQLDISETCTSSATLTREEYDDRY